MDLAHEFPLDEGLVYLNHAAVAPWPRRTAAAVEAFARENLRQGSLGYPRWLERETRLRERLRRLLNAASSTEIALVKNTSEALSFVAYGIDWRPGDEVVISDQEFPSNRIVWQSLAAQGVVVRRARLDAATPEDALLAAFGPRTRLLAISSVQYGTGLRVDLERLGAHCRRCGVLFCVDAIQSLGALRFDVQCCGADFVMADGHKWMLGPEGLGVFYCRAERLEQLRLTQYGWHMVARPGDFDADTWEAAPDARRFECGSPNMLGVHALEASLDLLEEIGYGVVEERIGERADYLIEALCGRGFEMLSPAVRARRGGIVTFRPRGGDPAVLQQALMERRVMCAYRGGGIRFSPHFYTSFGSLDAALAILDGLT